MWNQRRRVPSDVMIFSVLTLTEWIHTQGIEGFPSLQPLIVGDSEEHWVSLVGKEINVNVDAAIFEEEVCFGVGFIARDIKWYGNGGLLSALTWRGFARSCGGDWN